ncbi:MAG: class poly(R)-hydroxyalkanoic acid synthase [Novosphingobium sp.]|nr:class poly(R)-hydroxyalkanoic acid synthase [Novosphingobium sp.]
MDDSPSGSNATDIFGQILKLQTDALKTMGQAMLRPMTAGTPAAGGDPADWTKVGERLQTLWTDFQQGQMGGAAAAAPGAAQWLTLMGSWGNAQKKMWEDGTALWKTLLGASGEAPEMPREDRRFADPRWRDQPLYAVLHQTYLMLAEQMLGAVDKLPGIDPVKQEHLRFAVRTLTEALSPDHFPLTNPLVIDRAIETKGESLVKGMQHLITDLQRGQLTHTDPNAFKLGENIAVTPGKVVHESRLFQLIQYTPTTENVLAVPLVIFPPWINRFYILDLNPAKSFVRWAAEQGITVFMASWKSADASTADVGWDDYIRAQMEAIDAIRARLKVPAVHAIGYCVAGTTLAATLAIMARRGEADKVRTATFFTAQVDFEKAGELRNFIDDHQIETLAQLSPEGYLDGRYMAATFNLLRGNDLIWSYVVNNYLLGKEYPAFDLLHWNGDTTNLPVKWHQSYLKDLYRDNRLVQPDSLEADGTPIDLRLVKTPSFVQAGREDHIAPPESVWRTTKHFAGPVKFMLAGSGHIAGVVNPPTAKKYQYWANEKPAASLDEFIAGAHEHPGSWWPYWAEWLRQQDSAEVPAKGKRAPGGKGDTVIEDAPGRYVRMR